MLRLPGLFCLASCSFMLVACPQVEEDDPIDSVVELGPAPVLSAEMSGRNLTELAQEAILLAPTWVAEDLALNLLRLKKNHQDEFAALLVDLDEPWLLDEVAFSIAHMSPEVLSLSDFYPQVLVENAQMIYARDEALKYVEIVDEGDPGIDTDYWTTTRYRIEDLDGNIEEKTIEPEIYYWYLVHPRMEDEYPYYVDGWASCSGSECSSTPEEGQFWREFLWDGALEECPEDRECPVVRDYVTDESIDVMWKSKPYDRSDKGAIGALINWQKSAMRFGAGDERPIQPNRIYAVGCGNCGEWADIATAAARAALIPSQNVGARANDHTWNEFWDDGWMQWEPVNTYVGHWYYYQNQEGDTKESNAVYAITASRGDGYSSTERTVDYGNTFELTVEVVDKQGVPVDGADITMYGPILVYPEYEGYWWYAAEATTGPNGLAKLTLGEMNDYALRVDSTIGSNPPEENYILPFLESSTAGQDEFYSVTIDAEMPSLSITELESQGSDDLLLTLGTDLDYRLASDGSMLRGSFSIPVETGRLARFVVDQSNYEAFSQGEPFEAHYLATALGSESDTLLLNSSEASYLVLANDLSEAVSVMGDLEVVLSRADGGLWEGDVEEVELHQKVLLRPGQHLAVHITP